MAHRLARTGAALAAAAMLMLPTAASADSSHDHASPSADPYADHDTGRAHDHDESPAAPEKRAGTCSADPAPTTTEDEQASAACDLDQADQDDHEDHDATTQSGGHEDHGDHGATAEEDDGGHTDHGTAPDSVSPEVRNLVLSGFAGVNAAAIFGAWMVRRTGPDPDPRKRTPKASR